MVAIVQDEQITVGATPFTHTISGVAENATLVVVISQTGAANRIYSVSDDQGNTWSISQTNVAARQIALAYATGVSAGAVELTISSNFSTTPTDAWVFELEESSLDASDSFSRASNDTTHHAAPAGEIDTTTNVAVILAGIHNAPAVPSPSSGYTEHSSGNQWIFATRESAAALVDERGEWASATARNSAGVIASFYSSGGGPSFSPWLVRSRSQAIAGAV